MITAILQARTSSNRLPGKVLMPILGKPMLELQLERLARARKIDKLIVATSVESGDDPIAELCRKLRVTCFRGSLDDVLDRYYQAAKMHRANVIVRLTGDCPLTDPQVIDKLIEFFQTGTYDYAGNCRKRTWPIGLDAEIMTFAALETAWKEAELPSEREHVTRFVVTRPDKFSLGDLTGKADLSHHRWTVDEPEDFTFVKTVYEKLYPENAAFTTWNILKLLESRPELTEINYHIKHGEGLQKSLREDAARLNKMETAR